MNTLGITHSVCNICRQLVPAKVCTDGTTVFFQKFCSEHGYSQNKVHSDLTTYLQTQRYVKPAWVPNEYSGRSNTPCPSGCGLCSRHEQHLCMPIVEITSRCDLTCPICIADAGSDWDMTCEEFHKIMDQLIRAEKQIDVLNISGGEPLLHPRLLDLLDEALRRPEIVRVSISTNGMALLRHPTLAHELHKRNVVISLQFDGFDDTTYEILRGQKLLTQKLDILSILAETQISTSLTVTVADRINTDQLPHIIDYLFCHPHIISMMIQPLAYSGRGSHFRGRIDRLTIPDIVKRLGDMGDNRIRSSDFVPLPCSHPLCFYLAYYLILNDGNTVSVNQLIDASKMMDSVTNRSIFGLDRDEQEHLRDLIYEIWSGPVGTAPDSEKVMVTLRRILDEISTSGFDPRKAFTTTERHIKSIFIHEFQDAETFDLSRVRRCCNAYALPDGQLIPVCVHNVSGRRRK
jgi:7,8-dihydro-6-hydroxymethylpterin dimethyltransferase